MIGAAIPGVVVNALRKNGAVRDIRRMATLESAVAMVGGQDALADALGISGRLLRQKIAAERPIHDHELRLAAAAVTARAAQAAALAARLTSLIENEVAN